MEGPDRGGQGPTSGCCAIEEEEEEEEILPSVREILSSNLGPESGYKEIFRNFPQPFRDNAGNNICADIRQYMLIGGNISSACRWICQQ
jgi:hypothetical protein